MSQRFPSAVDVVVVGAGAAGIAAARRALERGLSVLVLEARDRLGGRAHTALTEFGVPVDLGCEWLHSGDRNPWTTIARELGFTVDEKRPGWGRLRRAGASDADQRDWEAVSDAFDERIAALIDGPDRSAAELLEPGGRWNALLDAISTYVSGAELHLVSAQDSARYDDTGINWRIREGFGAVIAAYGAALPVAFGAAVRRIDWSGRREVVVETDAGAAVRGKAAIVTVPTPLLAAEAIRFAPALPLAKLEAAHALPLGVADKAYLAIDAGGFADAGPDTYAIGAIDRVATGSYQIKPHGYPVIEAFFGGALARELEAAGPAAMAQFAIDELAKLFGGGVRGKLRPLATTAWERDPYARGGYSYARPGQADARAALAAPIEDRLFFAGEACSLRDFTTAHGAYATGIAAADAAADAIGG